MNKEFETMARRGMYGHQDAVEELLTSLKPLVLAYSKKYGGVKGKVDEDAYQEGMLEILEGLRDFDTTKNIPFLGYITTRIRHYYQNRRRKQKHHYSLYEKVGGEDSTITMLDVIPDKKINIQEEYIVYEEYDGLRKSITNLTTRQRDIIIAYYFNEEGLKEIAAKRNIHPISVAKTKATALKNLKKLMGA